MGKKKKIGIAEHLALGRRDVESETNVKTELLKHSSVDGTRSIDLIKQRPSGDTRELSIASVIALMESIDAIGLLEPIVVDKKSRLVAGKHRWAAILLLSVQPTERGTLLRKLTGVAPKEMTERMLQLRQREELTEIPIRVLNFDSTTKDGEQQALAAEAAENTTRHQYTATEVAAIANRLRLAGFSDVSGRPRSGTKPLKPALATILGMSPKKVQRILNQDKVKQAPTSDEKTRRAEKHLLKSLDLWLELKPKLSLRRTALELRKKLKASLPD